MCDMFLVRKALTHLDKSTFNVDSVNTITSLSHPIPLSNHWVEWIKRTYAYAYGTYCNARLLATFWSERIHLIRFKTLG